MSTTMVDVAAAPAQSDTEPSRRGKAPLTEQHKQQMRIGRQQSAAVRHYLQAIATVGGNVQDPAAQIERAKTKLSDLESGIPNSNPIERLKLTQEVLNLKGRISKLSALNEVTDAEGPFVECAKAFSDRFGITRAAWKAQGVPGEVLDKAGITD